MTISRRTAERLRLAALTGSLVSLMVVIIGLLTPAEDLPRNMPSDLLLHAVGFGVPTLMAAFASWTRRGLVLATLAIAAVALFTELAQFIVPGRDASVHDGVADAIGIAIGCSIGKLLQGLLLAPVQSHRGQRNQS